MRIPRINVPTANGRHWSNRFLDLLEGTAILRDQYHQKAEALEFRQQLDVLRQESEAFLRQFSKFAEPLQLELVQRGIGRHRFKGRVETLIGTANSGYSEEARGA